VTADSNSESSVSNFEGHPEILTGVAFFGGTVSTDERRIIFLNYATRTSFLTFSNSLFTVNFLFYVTYSELLLFFD